MSQPVMRTRLELSRLNQKLNDLQAIDSSCDEMFDLKRPQYIKKYLSKQSAAVEGTSKGQNINLQQKQHQFDNQNQRLKFAINLKDQIRCSINEQFDRAEAEKNSEPRNSSSVNYYMNNRKQMQANKDKSSMHRREASKQNWQSKNVSSSLHTERINELEKQLALLRSCNEKKDCELEHIMRELIERKVNQAMKQKDKGVNSRFQDAFDQLQKMHVFLLSLQAPHKTLEKRLDKVEKELPKKVNKQDHQRYIQDSNSKLAHIFEEISLFNENSAARSCEISEIKNIVSELIIQKIQVPRPETDFQQINDLKGKCDQIQHQISDLQQFKTSIQANLNSLKSEGQKQAHLISELNLKVRSIAQKNIEIQKKYKAKQSDFEQKLSQLSNELRLYEQQKSSEKQNLNILDEVHRYIDNLVNNDGQNESNEELKEISNKLNDIEDSFQKVQLALKCQSKMTENIELRLSSCQQKHLRFQNYQTLSSKSQYQAGAPRQNALVSLVSEIKAQQPQKSYSKINSQTSFSCDLLQSLTSNAYVFQPSHQ